jgi:hypothetical protein
VGLYTEQKAAGGDKHLFTLDGFYLLLLSSWGCFISERCKGARYSTGDGRVFINAGHHLLTGLFFSTFLQENILLSEME